MWHYPIHVGLRNERKRSERSPKSSFNALSIRSSNPTNLMKRRMERSHSENESREDQFKQHCNRIRNGNEQKKQSYLTQ